MFVLSHPSFKVVIVNDAGVTHASQRTGLNSEAWAASVMASAERDPRTRYAAMYDRRAEGCPDDYRTAWTLKREYSPLATKGA